MKKIVFEWRTRIIDFTTKEEAEKYLDEMCKKYNVCKSTYEIYKNGQDELPYTLKVEFTGKNTDVSGGW